MKLAVPNVGAVGVVKDLSVHELPIQAWSDAENIRFLDGLIYQSLGHGEVYATPSEAAQFLMPLNIAGVRYWIYATATKCFAVSSSGGTVTHTDITHATPRTGVVNQWTGTVLGGIPILNVGDTTHVPMYWDQNLANNFVNVTAWPANTYCKSLRSYKGFLVALHLTKSGTAYPFMVKWSSPAEPGALPTTYDETDATNDAGEFDLAEGQDPIIDGMPLRDSFIIYKESSIWRMDYTGGVQVFRFQKVLGSSGAMNRNCIVEADGVHVVLTGFDVIVHDGQSPSSILDRQARRTLFQSIDVNYRHLCFVFKNPFLNEVYIAYPSIGSTVCNKAVVYNYKDKTVSFRSLPNVNHASFGPVESTASGSIDSDSAPIDSDLTACDGPDYTPDAARVIMASTTSNKLYLLDSSASFDGTLPSAYLERRGLSFGEPERMKLVTGIRARITGNVGDTVTIKIGYADDPYEDPTYTSMTYTIGTTVRCDCLVSGRYLSVRFETGTAYQWRLDSYDIEYELQGEW